MAIYSVIFAAIVACCSYVAYQKYVTVYTSFVVKPLKSYDYIIVGAGTSGCVLAARLSEDPANMVLLIEAGDHMGYFTRIPLTATAAQQRTNDWAVKSTRQRYSSFGMWNQTQFIPRGKGLGGSGQINFLLHGFGLPSDLRWSGLGFKGWSYEELKGYFVRAFGTVKSEFDSDHCPVDGDCPGVKAPMKLKLGERDELMSSFKQASALLQDDQTVFLRATATLRDGSRHSSYDGYLRPALGRKNLHVLLRTQAVSIRFEGTIASSLYILQNHRQLNNVFVNKEIILSAGAIKTPQILMASGIGPRRMVEKLKVKPVAFNEAVGQNLHDHMNMPIYVSVKKPVTVTLAKVFTITTLWQYFWSSSGFLSFPPVAGIEYYGNSSVVLFSMGTASEQLLRDLSNYKPKVFRDTYAFHNVSSKEGFMWLCSCLQPRSRGDVTLSDTRTVTPPLVNFNYLRDRRDVRCIIKAIRRAEQLTASRPFQELGARIHWPRPERCLTYWNYSAEEQKSIMRKRRFRKEPSKPNPVDAHKSPPDEYLECIIREVAVTGHHAGGSCAGGKVVDQLLRVKSVSGLRIMDASILPAPISLFPNSVLIAMAEKAADIIRNCLLWRRTKRSFPMCKTNVRLRGKVAVITGGGSGMGLEAATDLAYRGARVIIASRNATKLAIARDNIKDKTGNPNVDFKVLNLESLASVRRFAHEMKSEGRLDMLINNAGGVGLPDELTEDGLTRMMQLNYFGPFLLTFLLLPMLKASAPSRIINSSAVSMYFGKIDFDHWNDLGVNDILLASGNAKLATALITVEWDRRLKGTGVAANSFDPFFVKDTDILGYLNKSYTDASLLLLHLVGRPKKEVGQQIAYYAAAPSLANVSGAHYKFCLQWSNHWQAGDRKLRKRLWRETKRAVQITPDEDWEAKGLLKWHPLPIPKLSIRL